MIGNKRSFSEEGHDLSRSKKLRMSVEGQGCIERNDSGTWQSRGFSRERRREIDRNERKSHGEAGIQQRRDAKPLNYMALDKICS